MQTLKAQALVVGAAIALGLAGCAAQDLTPVAPSNGAAKEAADPTPSTTPQQPAAPIEEGLPSTPTTAPSPTQGGAAPGLNLPETKP